MRFIFFAPALVLLFHVPVASACAQSPPATDGRASIDSLIQLLRDKDAGVRAGAADSLAKRWKTAAPAVPALVKVLDDGDENVRMHARDALMSIGDPAIPALTEVVKKGPIRKRLLALEAVAAIASGPPRQGDVFKDLLSVLLECLKDKNPHIRSWAVHCLTYVRDASCVPRLMKVLEKDKDMEVRYEVLQVFIAYGEKAAAATPLLARMVVRDYETHYQGMTTLGEEAADALSSIGEPAVPALAGIIADKKLKRAIRRTALSALSRMAGDVKSAAVAPVLCRALTDQDEEIRRSAAAIPGQMKSADERVSAALLVATKDKNPWVRMEAAMSIYHFNPQNPIVLATLLPNLDDKNAEVRRSACVKLGEIGAREANPAIPKLINMVIDADSDVRLEAIKALHTMARQKANIRAASPALMIAAILDRNADVRDAARKCLNRAKR